VRVALKCGGLPAFFLGVLICRLGRAASFETAFRLVLAGVVNQRDNWGKSEFTLLEKEWEEGRQAIM
jgi:hypothetical protein